MITYRLSKAGYFLLAFLTIVFPLSLKSQDNLPHLVNKVLPSIVTLISYDEDGYTGQGSGFFISGDGRLVTNRHVLEDAVKAEVRLGTGEVIKISHIIAEDEESDIIIVKVSVESHLFPYLLVSDNPPIVGEKIIAIGSPRGFEQTVSDGIVSAIRDVESFGIVYQVTTPASPGSSGGPIINMAGEVIGIVTFQHKEGQNLNFALPGSRIKNLTHINSPFENWVDDNTYKKQSDADHLYREGVKFVMVGNYKEALAIFENAVSINPNDADLHYYIGRCRFKLGLYREALQSYSRAIELSPNDDFLFWSRALVKMDLGDYFGGNHDLTIAIKINPNSVGPNYYYHRAYLNRMHLEDYHGAIQDLNTAIRLDPIDASFYADRGSLKSYIDDYHGAIQDLNTAIRLDPIDASYYAFRGGNKSYIDDYQGAIQDLNTAISLDPNESYYYSVRGGVKTVLEDYHGAIQDLNNAIRLDPNYAYAYAQRGRVKRILMDDDGAIRDFNIAIRIEPESGFFYYQRGFVKIYAGDIRGGCLDFSKAGELGYIDAYGAIRRYCQ